jgi:pyrroline-5-carboxylate reductase
VRINDSHRRAYATLSEPESQLVDWIFDRLGRFVHIPVSIMGISTGLYGLGPAFVTLMLESMVDGAVFVGLPRVEAQLMTAQTMRGTAEMVLSGDHPALIREKMSTPGGCTIEGLQVLEKGCVRGTIAKTIREVAVTAAELGKSRLIRKGTPTNVLMANDTIRHTETTAGIRGMEVSVYRGGSQRLHDIR